MKKAFGFSIIELLIVCAIIGILAALMQPVLKQAVMSAKTSAAVSQMGQLTKAFMLYREDWASGSGGSASGLGLPTIEMQLAEWDLYKSLPITARPLLLSPCGSHPYQPHTEWKNIAYLPADLEEISGWGAWYSEQGEAAVFVYDVNCTDHSIPLYTGLYTRTIIGGKLDGGLVRRRDKRHFIALTDWRGQN